MKYIFPDYNHCLTNLSNSILKYFSVDTYHNTLKELDEFLENNDYKNVVLMLYDGMGSNLTDRALDENSFLRKHKVTDINAVFPPTTTASTTSVLSGLNPNEHGLVGWDVYVKELDEVVSMFVNVKKDTDEKYSESIIDKYYHYTSIIELINKKHKAYKLVPFGEDAYEDINDMNKRIIDLCKDDGKKFIYAYTDEPDHTMHRSGTDAKESIDLFKMLNDSTEKLCNTLEDTLVIVVADHGHLNCDSITLSDYPDIFNLLEKDVSIEGRACNFFIKKGKEKDFEELFDKYFKDDFKLYTKEEVIENKFFGDGVEHEKFRSCLGDYLAVATSNKYFRYNENSKSFLSVHAGTSEDEVLVPLIVYEAK